jgi:phage/plasmid primase-like uncharacterized protein
MQSRPDIPEGRYRRLRTVAELKQGAAGKWPDILQDLAPELELALAHAPEHVPCPRHGGENGFRLFDDYVETGGAVCNTCGFYRDGFVLLAWLKGWELRRTLDEVGRWLGAEPAQQRGPRRPPPIPVQKDPARARAALEAVWRGTRPLAGTVAERYLERRGIWRSNMSPILRFHEGLAYYRGRGKEAVRLGVFPALVAPVLNQAGELVSLHRTFLDAQGNKAPVPEAKKLMAACAPLNGAAIPLFASATVLGLAEGIETALAARAIARIPVWSTLNRVLLEQVDLPQAVRHVVIFADKDASYDGMASAEAAAERLVAQGRTVEVVCPSQPIPPGEKGLDWLDVLNRFGIEGFPARWRNWRATA